MQCRACNTRLDSGARTCPNCGADAGPEAGWSRSSKPNPLPAPGLSRAKDEDLELELDDVTGEEPAVKPRAKNEDPPVQPHAKKKGGQAPLFAPDPAGLRALLAEQPDALESGLSLFQGEGGSGAGYASGVGEIDLLARDRAGNLVVVMISEKGQGEELVAEVLQRVGWVRKHLGEGKRTVRGIVLCEEPPQNPSYTAAAVSDTISFKTYRIALTFDDLEI